MCRVRPSLGPNPNRNPNLGAAKARVGPRLSPRLVWTKITACIKGDDGQGQGEDEEKAHDEPLDARATWGHLAVEGGGALARRIRGDVTLEESPTLTCRQS